MIPNRRLSIIVMSYNSLSFDFKNIGDFVLYSVRMHVGNYMLIRGFC